MKIYLARPISGKSYLEVSSYYNLFRGTLDVFGYEVLCPMTAKGFLRNEKKFKASGYKNPVSTNHAIVERDCWMVQQSDVVLVDFTGADEVSIGCVMELAWASLLGKHTVIILPQENVHRHAFVLEAADIIFEYDKEALDYLKYLIKGRIE
jgi:nucleoside 2-deoxyribosyltransferase